MKIDLGFLESAAPQISTLPELSGEPRPPIIDEFGTLRIDNSSLEYFSTCARSAEYYLLDRREGVRGKSPLIFGGAIHAALEARYRSFGRGIRGIEGEVMEVVQKSLDSFFTKTPLISNDHRTPQRAADVLWKYLCFYEEEPFSIVSGESGPIIERYFEVPLGEVEFNAFFEGRFHKTLRILWCGRIDLCVEMEGQVFILDHKTSYMRGESFFANFINSGQMLGYTYAMSKILRSPVAGLFLNALFIRKPTKTGVAEEFERQRFLYSLDRVAEWQHNTLTLVSDFLSHLSRGFFPMHSPACVGKFGQCQYLETCMMPPEQRATMLASNFYRPVTWTPKREGD